MANALFDWNSTADQVLAGVVLTGKRVLITGVSAGLGVETARALVARGAEVVGTARDLDKADVATAAVQSAVSTGGGKFDLVEMDLASLESVRRCADALMASGRPFDLVIANAGVMATPFGLTEDGFEMQFGTNHLGHFVLVNRVAALMPSEARLVMLASSSHRVADVDLVDPNFEKKAYSQGLAYSQSKTANILFAVEFDRRHRSRGVRATAVHPGTVRTELGRHADPIETQKRVDALNAQLAAEGKTIIRWKSVAQGAATSVWAGVIAPAELVGGRYCEDCHLVEPSTDGGFVDGASPHAFDPETARALWALSEDLVGETF